MQSSICLKSLHASWTWMSVVRLQAHVMDKMVKYKKANSTELRKTYSIHTRLLVLMLFSVLPTRAQPVHGVDLSTSLVLHSSLTFRQLLHMQLLTPVRREGITAIAAVVVEALTIAAPALGLQQQSQ